MFNQVFKASSTGTSVNGDTLSFGGKNGKPTNGELHDQIMKGVDPNTGNEYMQAIFKGLFTQEELDKFFPMPKNPDDLSDYDPIEDVGTDTEGGDSLQLTF